MTVTIPLTRGYVALIDDEDFDLVKGYSWRTFTSKTKNRTVFYAATNMTKKVVGSMHRLIMNAPIGMDVDHINHNGLDNRRSNLRLATRSQNKANGRNINKTGFIGVSENRGKYYGKVAKEGKYFTTSGFHDPRDAAIARDQLAYSLFGEYAILNNVAPDFVREPAPAPKERPKRTSIKRNNFYGVGKRGNRYRAWIAVGEKTITVGSFATEIEAAMARDARAIEIFGEGVSLNFPAIRDAA